MDEDVPSPQPPPPSPPRVADAHPEPLDYRSPTVDRELHTESAAEVLRAIVVVFLIIFMLVFLVCGGFVGLMRGVGGAVGF